MVLMFIDQSFFETVSSKTLLPCPGQTKTSQRSTPYNAYDVASVSPASLHPLLEIFTIFVLWLSLEATFLLLLRRRGSKLSCNCPPKYSLLSFVSSKCFFSRSDSHIKIARYPFHIVEIHFAYCLYFQRTLQFSN